MPLHLARRFVTSLDPRPTSLDDELFAGVHLTTREHTLWTQLGDTDRRHAVTVARRFLARRPSATSAEVAGALLHDIGKIAGDLPTWRRVLVTVQDALGRTPRRADSRRYLDHEAIGADLLRRVGSDPTTIETALGRGSAGGDLRHADQV
jgi:hypothetical protein